jgi:hypothetical protein
VPLFALLHVLIAAYFGVHAIRTGRNMTWLFVLLSFPFLGSLIYFFAEYLPETRHSRTARKAVSTMRSLIDPGRDVRDARIEFERTPSVENRFRLADALLRAGAADEALSHFEQCAAGPYARDVKLRLGLAHAQLTVGQNAAAARTLDVLFADEPEQRCGQATLWHAKALAELDLSRAHAAFEQALQLHAGIETACAFGLFLIRHGEPARGRALLEQALREAKLGTAYSRDVHRASIDQANAALKALDERATAA